IDRCAGGGQSDAGRELQVIARWAHLEEVGVADSSEHDQLVAAERLPAVVASEPRKVIDRLAGVGGEAIALFLLALVQGDAARTAGKQGEGRRYSRKSRVLVQHAVLLRVKVSFLLRCLRPAPGAEGSLGSACSCVLPDRQPAAACGVAAWGSASGASQPQVSSATGNSARACAASRPTLSPWRTGESCAPSRTLRNVARERSSRGSSMRVSPHTASPRGSAPSSPSRRRYRRGATTTSDCCRQRRAKAHRCCARTPRTRRRR